MICDSHHQFIVFSNLSYLMPVVASIYMWWNGRMPAHLAVELGVLFIGVFMISWLYHTCRNGAVESVDPCENDPVVKNPCVKCADEDTALQWMDTSLASSMFADSLLATYVAMLCITHILPLRPVIRSFIRSTFLIVVMIMLLKGVEDYIAVLPGIIISVFIFNPISLMNSEYMTISERILVAVLSISSLIALLLFLLPKDNYWLYHSMWHIVGAVASTVAILLSGSFYDIPDDKFGASLYHMVTDKSVLKPL